MAGKADVFANLADVDVGDKVQVYENGRTIAYRVTRASVIDKDEVDHRPGGLGAERLPVATGDHHL